MAEKGRKKSRDLRVVLPVCLLLAACAALSVWILMHVLMTGNEVTLTIAAFSGNSWGVPVDDSFIMLDEAIEKFEAAHPNVRIVYDSGIAMDEYSEYLSGRLLKDEAPDLMYVLDSDFDMLIRTGALENLDSYISGSDGLQTELYYDAFLKTGQKDGSQYTLPVEGMTEMMFVNESLLAREMVRLPASGYSFEDMYDICRRVTKDKDGDGVPDQFGVCGYDWQDAAVSAGAVMFDENGQTVNLASGEMKQAILFMQSLNELNQGQTITQETFDEGRVAFMPLTIAEYRTYRSYPYQVRQYGDFEWDCIRMPKGAKGGNDSTVSAMNVGISAAGKHKRLAWEFLKYISSDEEMQKQMFRSLPVVSVLKSVMNSDEAEYILGKNNATLVHANLIDAVLTDGVVNPKFDGYEDRMEQIDNTIRPLSQTNTGATDLDYVLRTLQRRIKEDMK